MCDVISWSLLKHFWLIVLTLVVFYVLFGGRIEPSNLRYWWGQRIMSLPFDVYELWVIVLLAILVICAIYLGLFCLLYISHGGE